MSRKIGLGFTNIATGNKSFNNPIGGIGARSKRLRNAINLRSSNCCSDNNNNSQCDSPYISVYLAKRQGCVLKGQILCIKNNEGLILEDDFCVELGGFILFCDIENPNGNVPNLDRSLKKSIDNDKFAALYLAPGKVLKVMGEIAMGYISSDETNNKDIYGIYNRGTIEISETGSIA